jgi:hypothetical protein
MDVLEFIFIGHATDDPQSGSQFDVRSGSCAVKHVSGVIVRENVWSSSLFSSKNRDSTQVSHMAGCIRSFDHFLFGAFHSLLVGRVQHNFCVDANVQSNCGTEVLNKKPVVSVDLSLVSVAGCRNWFKKAWEIFYANPRAMGDRQSISGGIGGAFGSVRCLIGRTKSEDIYEKQPSSDDDRSDLSRLLPRWGVIFAPLGLMFLSWGWWNLRSSRRLRLAERTFWAGAFLWMYGFAVVLNWITEA